MSDTAIQRVGAQALVRPEPRMPLVIREATPGSGDIEFVDALQKKHSRIVGWFPTKQLETNIKQGKVLIADSGSLSVGYCISSDRYFKRDDCGIVYQLNVEPTKHRGLIGASLIQAVFERAAYGCKLFCCWCAQDLEANHFWESLGFVPLAFRTGSRRAGQKKEPRIHIFWQRRIREGNVETPFWFPSETSGGAVRENRLVLPIPPGTHWSDAKPAVLPGMERLHEALPAGEAELKRPRKRSRKQTKKTAEPKRPSGGLWFAPPEPTAEEKKAAKAAARKAKPEKKKNDPKFVAAARELRDRFLEEAERNPNLLCSTNGKYEVSRALEAGTTTLQMNSTPLLDAA